MQPSPQRKLLQIPLSLAQGNSVPQISIVWPLKYPQQEIILKCTCHRQVYSPQLTRPHMIGKEEKVANHGRDRLSRPCYHRQQT